MRPVRGGGFPGSAGGVHGVQLRGGCAWTWLGGRGWPGSPRPPPLPAESRALWCQPLPGLPRRLTFTLVTTLVTTAAMPLAKAGGCLRVLEGLPALQPAAPRVQEPPLLGPWRSLSGG